MYRWWRHSVVVSGDGLINEVNRHWARLVFWMGDRLWVGKPSRYVASHLGQLSLPVPSQVNRVPACLAGVRQGEFTCVGWKVTLCDPIW